jgi:hypothetical protein
MDAFEQLVGQILSTKGFWVRSSFKVDLTKEEKRLIGRHSAPRWELDIVAYRASDNTLYVVECKSYLDSRGVTAAAFVDSDSKEAKLYKLFTEPNLYEVVSQSLSNQLLELGACRENPRIQLALACGKIRNALDRETLHAHFKTKKWELWDEAWLKESIRYMATESYENQVSSVVAKLMLRNER